MEQPEKKKRIRLPYKKTDIDRTKCKYCERDLLANEMHHGRITCRRCAFLRTRYNMTGRDYMFILAKQNGVCAICKSPEVKPKKGAALGMELNVDHCHKTGKVRGLLCWKCNTGIGAMRDNEQFLWNAIMYLKTSQNLDIKPAKKERQNQRPKGYRLIQDKQ